jgi:hypothetical protein
MVGGMFQPTPLLFYDVGIGHLANNFHAGTS